jgi:hypothetical protein
LDQVLGGCLIDLLVLLKPCADFQDNSEGATAKRSAGPVVEEMEKIACAVGGEVTIVRLLLCPGVLVFVPKAMTARPPPPPAPARQ